MRPKATLRAHSLSLLCARSLDRSLSRAREQVADASFGFFFFAASVPARALSLARARESELRILHASSTLDVLVPEAQF
jgi:hypothetical protein